MLKKLSLLAMACLLSACAAIEPAPAPVAPNWQAGSADFGFLNKLVNKKYILRTMSWTPTREDNGLTYVFDGFKLRNTAQPGVLQVMAKPPGCRTASAVMQGANKLVINCETWDDNQRLTYTPNTAGGFDRLFESKSTAGLNFLQDYEYVNEWQTKPYSEAALRQEMQAAAWHEQRMAEEARQRREDERASSEATARAFGNAMATLSGAANQVAQQQAAQAAQIRAQAEARRESQAQAQRDAAARQYQQAQENARQATQRQYDIARQYEQQQAAQAQRKAEAEAQRKAEAQARQDAANRQRQEASRKQAALTVAQTGSGNKTASQVNSIPSKPATSASAPPPLPTQNGKDLNCNTERQCWGECLKGPKDGVYACQKACTARSTCKVSLQ
ncbi:hypothetical protein [Massilia suwonensis]|uniref:Lipoprotein n=1 Tax=Massilia suwonensis TaxID=648895 RepID=A0ABW0MVL4_9BURK